MIQKFGRTGRVLVVLCLLLQHLFCSADEFTFEKLKGVIQDHHIKSIEELIPQLPKEFRENYVVMLNSQSRQGAYDSKPRVLLFGGKPGHLSKDYSKIIMSFNTDLHENGFYQLEVMQFRRDTGKFEFREIEFSPSASEEPTFSQKNPMVCTACHGDNPRPIWDKLPLWPGSLESTRFAEKTSEYLKMLKGVQKEDERLKLLSDIPDPTRTTYALNFLLNDLNSLSVAQEIAENSKLIPYRYAIIAARFCSPYNLPINQLIPKSIRASFDKSLVQVTLETQKLLKQNFLNRVALIEKHLGTLPETSPIVPYKKSERKPKLETLWHNDTPMVARLRYIVEGAGVSMKDWSMASDRSSYAFDNHFFRNLSLWEPLYSASGFDSELAKLILKIQAAQMLNESTQLPASDPLEGELCDALILKSQEAFLDFEKLSESESLAVPKPLSFPKAFSKCVGCHKSSLGIAPPISFGDEAALMDQLKGKDTNGASLKKTLLERISPETAGGKIMPPSGALDQEARSEIDAYLASLAIY